MRLGGKVVNKEVSFTVKISASDRDELLRLSEELAIPADVIIRSMIRKFISVGGFPYEVGVRPRPVVNWDSPLILKTREEKGKLIMPKEWRDEEDLVASEGY